MTADPRDTFYDDILTPVRESAAQQPAGAYSRAELAQAEAAIRRAHPTWTSKQVQYVIDHAIRIIAASGDDLDFNDAVRDATAGYAQTLPARVSNAQNAAALDTILDSGRR